MHYLISETGRFRDAVVAGATQDHRAGGIRIGEMAGAHIDRADVRPSAQHVADGDTRYEQRGTGTTQRAGFGERAKEAAFGAADGR
jgi:hypothetical protein